jgi:hypothetical protein
MKLLLARTDCYGGFRNLITLQYIVHPVYMFYNILIMSVLTPPRDTLVNEALHFTRENTKGEIIDGSTVLRHAVGVVVELEKYVPDVSPQLAAGIIMHDTPYVFDDQEALDAKLLEFGEEPRRIVRAIEREHEQMGKNQPDGYNEGLQRHVKELLDDRPVLLATTADKIVSFRSITGRAQAAPDRAKYWEPRGAFIRRMPYFQAFQAETAPHLPVTMAEELGRLVSLAYDLTQASER